jgi:hypothetical protein
MCATKSLVMRACGVIKMRVSGVEFFLSKKYHNRDINSIVLSCSGKPLLLCLSLLPSSISPLTTFSSVFVLSENVMHSEW